MTQLEIPFDEIEPDDSDLDQGDDFGLDWFEFNDWLDDEFDDDDLPEEHAS